MIHARRPGPATWAAVASASDATAAALYFAGLSHAECRITRADAVELARRSRAEMGQADLDVALARLGGLRAGFQRVHLTFVGRVTEQLDKYYVKAPAELCRSVEGLYRPASRSRLAELTAGLPIVSVTAALLWAGPASARVQPFPPVQISLDASGDCWRRILVSMWIGLMAQSGRMLWSSGKRSRFAWAGSGTRRPSPLSIQPEPF
jgi:hypothetical protein